MTQNWMTWEVSVSKTCVRLLTRDSSTSRQTLMSRYQAVDQKWRWKETLAKVGGSFNETVTIVLWETITWIQLGSISQSHTGFFFFFFHKASSSSGFGHMRDFLWLLTGFDFKSFSKGLESSGWNVGYRLSRVFSESFRFYMGGFGFYAEGFDGAFLFFQFHLIFSARLTLLLSLSSFWPRNPSRCRAKQSADFFCFVSFNRRPALMKVISVERCDLMKELVGKMFQWKIKDVIQKIDKKNSTNSIRNANNFHG